MTSSDERATKLFESLKEMGMSITPNPSDKNELWAKVINDCKEKALFVAGSFPSISNDIIIQLKEKYDLVYTQSVSDVRKALTESLGVSPSDENRKIGYY